MSATPVPKKRTARREVIVFLVLLPGGIFLLPILIYFIGSSMFGAYGGEGFSAFYGTVLSDLRAGDVAVWFLVLSPYLVWQLLRLTFRTFAHLGKTRSE